MNIFKLHEQKPVRLGHKKANNDKKSKMEEKGQLNLFEKKPAKIFSIDKKLSAFEQAFVFDENGDTQARELYLKAIEENDCSADSIAILESWKPMTAIMLKQLIISRMPWQSNQDILKHILTWQTFILIMKI